MRNLLQREHTPRLRNPLSLNRPRIAGFSFRPLVSSSVIAEPIAQLTATGRAAPSRAGYFLRGHSLRRPVHHPAATGRARVGPR